MLITVRNTVFPHIVSAAKIPFIKEKIEILRQLFELAIFPNSKKNSFRGNYEEIRYISMISVVEF